MLRAVVQSYHNGNYNPLPNWRIVRESPSTATIDGDGGLGVILGPKAMRIAIDKAKAVGVGIVTMYNGRHLGAVGHHAMLAAQEDMVGWAWPPPSPTSSRPLGRNRASVPILSRVPPQRSISQLSCLMWRPLPLPAIRSAWPPALARTCYLVGLPTPRALRSWRKRQCGPAASIFNCPWGRHGNWARIKAMVRTSWVKPGAQ